MKLIHDKSVSIEEAASWISDGDILAIGGNVLHRSPNAFIREIARQKKKRLEVVKTAGAYDIDLLSAVRALAVVHAGYVGYENEFGLCRHYRRGVESGRIKVNEHACYTVIAALRAAAYGIPFMPVNGLKGSDLIEKRGFQYIKDPYSEQEVVAIPRIIPDWAIIHVQEADREGNGRIIGQKFEDVLMSRSAKNVILTTERLVESSSFERNPELTDIPGFLVKAVVVTPRGGLPGSCPGRYDIHVKGMQEFLMMTDEVGIERHLQQYERSDRMKGGALYGTW